jgi:hypothetical protein
MPPVATFHEDDPANVTPEPDNVRPFIITLAVLVTVQVPEPLSRKTGSLKVGASSDPETPEVRDH